MYQISDCQIVETIWELHTLKELCFIAFKLAKLGQFCNTTSWRFLKCVKSSYTSYLVAITGHFDNKLSSGFSFMKLLGTLC